MHGYWRRGILRFARMDEQGQVCVCLMMLKPCACSSLNIKVFLNGLQSWDLCPRLLRGDFYPAESGEN